MAAKMFPVADPLETIAQELDEVARAFAMRAAVAETAARQVRAALGDGDPRLAGAPAGRRRVAAIRTKRHGTRAWRLKDVDTGDFAVARGETAFNRAADAATAAKAAGFEVLKLEKSA
jgi:hypothetical protein